MTEHPFHHEDGGAVLDGFMPRLTESAIWDLLTSAFEGGSNYWIDRVWLYGPDGEEVTSTVSAAMEVAATTGTATGAKAFDFDWEYVQDVPLLDGHLLIRCSEDPGKTKRHSVEGKKRIFKLDRAACVEGMRTMANLKRGEGRHHFPNLLAGNWDAETGDVYLQCCLFGEIIFG